MLYLFFGSLICTSILWWVYSLAERYVILSAQVARIEERLVSLDLSVAALENKKISAKRVK